MNKEQKPASQPSIDNRALLQHLERARRIVQEWPDWKREFLAQTTRPGSSKPAAT